MDTNTKSITSVNGEPWVPFDTSQKVASNVFVPGLSFQVPCHCLRPLSQDSVTDQLDPSSIVPNNRGPIPNAGPPPGPPDRGFGGGGGGSFRSLGGATGTDGTVGPPLGLGVPPQALYH